MLHVRNGDSSAHLLEGSNLPGDHLVWREALVAGPTPQGLAKEEWRKEKPPATALCRWLRVLR